MDFDPNKHHKNMSLGEIVALRLKELAPVKPANFKNDLQLELPLDTPVQKSR